MTEAERKYMEHLWKCRKWFGDAETLACAKRFAELDPFQLARLPELLQAEINKHNAKKGATA